VNLRPHRKEPPELSLAPLIDVVFLLLIFFMVSTTFEKESRLKLELPEAVTQNAETDAKRVIDIRIAPNGAFRIGDKMLASNDLDGLMAELERAAGGDKEKRIAIRADADTPHRYVVRAMDAASQLGLLRIAIPTKVVEAE
jgi:biopolymer transport protein ExbD